MKNVLTVKTIKLRTRNGWDHPVVSSRDIARRTVSDILKQIEQEIKSVSLYMTHGKRAEITFKITGRPLATRQA